MPHRGAGRDAFRSIDDGVGVDAVVPVEVGDGAGLAEMLDAERLEAVAAHAAEPAERGRMAVDHGHNAAVAAERRQQLLDMTQMLHAAAVAAQIPRGGPTRIEPIGRGYRQETDVAVALADQADRLDRLRRDSAGIR
ncbi:hypothetical protein chiPu_0032226, partial [Chiloscyllium punctatum]|nr:hypothetical protein [Chiloscyllium punctatum]